MNTEKFTGLADVYSKFRPGYPEALADWMYGEAGFSETSTVADVGAGTGIFSRVMLNRGSAVIAVEPNGDMRRQTEKLSDIYKKFTLCAASAENTGISGAKCDFVTAAQAFHWFDSALFKTECRRILKPHGKVLLVWNTRCETDPLTADYSNLNSRMCPAYTGLNGGHARQDDAVMSAFFETGWRKIAFENNIMHDLAGFVGRALSSSYAPKNDSPGIAAYVAGLTDIFNKHEVNGRVTVRNEAVVYFGKV